MEAIHVIKRPLLTEKCTYASNEHNRYGFLVARTATKDQIKHAVQELYNVRVLDVATHNRSGRDRLTRWGYVPGKTTKRAIVKVHPDDKIELF